MKKISVVYLIFAIVITISACNDPVFYYISVEPPIVHPYIEGSPASFVEYDEKLYVASGANIYSYDGTRWDKMILQPGGRITQLAATDTYLYALCYVEGKNSILRRYPSSSGEWEQVSGTTDGYDMLQSVYAMNDKDTVFIGAQKEENGPYTILYIDDDTSNTTYSVLTTGGASGLLCGMALTGNDYFLCTKSDTIYVFNNSSTPKISPITMSGVSFAGIINLDTSNTSNKIVAISRVGELYNVPNTIPSPITKVPDVSIGNGHFSTGALTVWSEGSTSLLLAGRQDRLTYSTNSGYTYGYKELELDTNGIKAGSNFKEPGEPPSTVVNYDRYVSTLRKNPVNHIFQTSVGIDSDMTLFASTQKNGIWSLRYIDRDDNTSEKVWNAEVNK